MPMEKAFISIDYIALSISSLGEKKCGVYLSRPKKAIRLSFELNAKPNAWLTSQDLTSYTPSNPFIYPALYPYLYC